jgi:hypothetical protein
MANDDRDDAAALGRYADHILDATGSHEPFVGDLDPALVATVRLLQTTGRRPAPAGARARVWNRLAAKASTGSCDPTIPDQKEVPMNATLQPLRYYPTRGDREAMTMGRRQPWPLGLVRRVSTGVATAALLAVTLAAIVAAYALPGGDSEGSRSVITSPATSQPGAVPTMAGYTIPTSGVIGTSMIRTSQLTFSTEHGLAITLYGWRVALSTSFSLPAGKVAAGSPLAADFVTGGTYRATFDRAVTVSRRGLLGGVIAPGFEAIPAGATVELLPGDSVTYPVGAKRTVANPLATVDLLVKTAMIAPLAESGVATPAPDDLSALLGEVGARIPRGVEARSIGFGTTQPYTIQTDVAAVLYWEAFYSTPDQPLPAPDLGDPNTHRVIGPAAASPGEQAGQDPEYAPSIRWEPRG